MHACHRNNVMNVSSDRWMCAKEEWVGFQRRLAAWGMVGRRVNHKLGVTYW